jgi:hypothetical protein
MPVLSTRYPAAILALTFAAALSGCAPAPEPSPSPTPAFASEEEAFAAAEEVYRAYNEAGNARIAGEESPDPQDFLIGEALEADIDGIRLFDEQGIHLSGAASVGDVSGLSVTTTTVLASVCIIATDVRVIDAEGADVTPADRPESSVLHVTFTEVDGDLLISRSELVEGVEGC